MALLVTSGMLALGATSASASVNAPAPNCGSYNSTLYCYGDQGTTISYTWTEKITVDGTSTTSKFAANYIRGACERGAGYTFSYSYVSGGTTYVSAATELACNPNPPE
jgi:hypothetical protein